MSAIDQLAIPQPEFIREPEPREVKFTLISVDDHLVEPPHMFEGRLPAHLQADAPRVVEDDQGRQQWLFDGELRTLTGAGTTAGLCEGYGGFETWRFEHMRAGWWKIDDRVTDMDINGVWAGLSFPTNLAGFAGRVFSSCSNPKLGLAVMKAWNDWLFEEWYSPYPYRIVPMSLTFLADPEAGAAEIRRNAQRGFKAVSLPERPQRIGLPDLFTGYWDPIVEACAETETVINLHIGSSGLYDAPPGAPTGLTATMFGEMSMAACAEWLWSGYPDRYPELKIALSEGGIGWVAMMLDRLDNIIDRSGYGAEQHVNDLRPAELLQRNFWFCTLDDPSTIDTRYRIGIDNIMAEVDYPHGDGTWPDTQAAIARYWGQLPPHELRAICCLNAASLYRHPLPEVVLPS